MDCSDDDDTEAGRPSTPLSFVHGSPILKLGRQSTSESFGHVYQSRPMDLTMFVLAQEALCSV